MKKIRLANGEIRNGYTFDDLSKEMQEKAISDHIDFEIEVMNEESPFYYLVEEMEGMQTPWFLGQVMYEKEKESIIESIEINGYLFTETAELLPITHYTGKHPLSGSYSFRYAKKEIPCVIASDFKVQS